MDYHVGQKIKVTMRTGFHAGEIIDRNATVEKVNGDMVWIRFPLKYGGTKVMFGTKHDLDKLVDWYKERHKNCCL